jgi:hypothetical protein
LNAREWPEDASEGSASRRICIRHDSELPNACLQPPATLPSHRTGGRAIINHVVVFAALKRFQFRHHCGAPCLFRLEREECAAVNRGRHPLAVVSHDERRWPGVPLARVCSRWLSSRIGPRGRKQCSYSQEGAPEESPKRARAMPHSATCSGCCSEHFEGPDESVTLTGASPALFDGIGRKQDAKEHKTTLFTIPQVQPRLVVPKRRSLIDRPEARFGLQITRL